MDGGVTGGISFLGMYLKEIIELFKKIIKHIEMYLQVYSLIFACFIVLTSGSVPLLSFGLLTCYFQPGCARPRVSWQRGLGSKVEEIPGSPECSLQLLNGHWGPGMASASHLSILTF